ncbi:MAG: uracil-DNA glycosylase, partial [Ignavibacteriaceae bacterium]
MNDKLKKQIIEALKDQKEIFGDDLFEENILNRRTKIVAEKKEKYSVEPELFAEEKEEWEKAGSLEKLESLIKDCTACKLCEG